MRQQAAYFNMLSDIFEAIDNQTLVKELRSIQTSATHRKNIDVMVTPSKKVREVVEIEIQTDTQSDKELQQGIILSQD